MRQAFILNFYLRFQLFIGNARVGRRVVDDSLLLWRDPPGARQSLGCWAKQLVDPACNGTDRSRGLGLMFGFGGIGATLSGW